MDETIKDSDLGADQNNEEQVEELEDSQSEDSTDFDVERLKAENAKLRDIAQRRKEKIETLTKGSQSTSNANSQAKEDTSPAISEDKVILYAKGFSKEEVEMAGKIASLNNQSILHAAEDPVFKAWKKTQEEKDTAEKAQLSASRGSGRREKEKSTLSPGLTPEEHKALWKKKVGLV